MYAELNSDKYSPLYPVSRQANGIIQARNESRA
jgi:hypothetical protein